MTGGARMREDMKESVQGQATAGQLDVYNVRVDPSTWAATGCQDGLRGRGR